MNAVDIVDVIRRDPRKIGVDLCPVDARTAERPRVCDREHRIPICKGVVQFEIVRVKIVEGLYMDIFCRDIERIVRNIIRLAAARHITPREHCPREIGMCPIAKVDCIPCGPPRACRISAGDSARHSAARHRDDIARRISCIRRIAADQRQRTAAADGHRVPCHVTRAHGAASLHGAIDRTARDRDAVAAQSRRTIRVVCCRAVDSPARGGICKGDFVVF